MSAFNVEQTAQRHGWDPIVLRERLRVLEIPPKEDRHPYHWEILRQVIQRKHIVTMPIEVGARVIFPIGIHWIEKITTIEGVPHLWALGDPYPISQCQYLYPNDRLSNWWGQCPKCHQNASDYLKRQRIGDRFCGGYAFCESCLTSWAIPKNDRAY